jgi:hypothetical protein
MTASTAVTEWGGERLGVMVRSAQELFIYWTPTFARSLVLQVRDLSGRPASALLDGTGLRERHLPAGERTLYVGALLPGHLYEVAIGEQKEGAFLPLLTAGPVQTPWLPREGEERFPERYHRS